MLVIFNETDPGIALNLTYFAPGETDKARGWHGRCTQCAKVVHYWTEDRAFRSGQEHVDSHTPSVIGIDRDSLVFNPLCP